MDSRKVEQGYVQGNMFITLDSSSVISGGVIHGKIHITLEERLTNPVLNLIFKGNELTDFKTQHHEYRGNYDIHYNRNNYYTHHSNRHRNRNHHQGRVRSYYTKHRGKQLLCALKTVIHQWPDLIARPGNFSFPFELKINDNLLPSFQAQALYEGFCEINYSVRAQLDAADRQPLKAKIPISVFTKSITLPQEMYPQSLSRDCRGYGSVFCCFKKESTIARVWIERGTFGNPDFIDIGLETNLSGFSANISKVEIEVNRVLTMTANKEGSKECTQVVNMLRDDKSVEIKANSGVQSCSFRVPIQSILKNEQYYSLSTQLIKCHFVLKLRLVTGFYCCKCYGFDEASQGFVILPFQIQDPMMPHSNAP